MFAPSVGIYPSSAAAKRLAISLAGLLAIAGTMHAATFELTYSASAQWAPIVVTPGSHTFVVKNVPGSLEVQWKKDGVNTETDDSAFTFTASYSATIGASYTEVQADFWTETFTGARNTYSHSHGWNVSPATYAATPGTRSVAAAATTGQSISISSNTTWSASSNVSWITITGGASGSGNGTVTYSVAANSATASRTGVISIGTATHTVTQAGAPPATSISPASRSFDSQQASGQTIGVTSNTTWSAASSVSWVTITGGSSGSGNGTVTYSVAANAGAARNGAITVASSTHAISQSAAPTTSVSATLTKGNGFANPANVQFTVGSQGPTNAGSGSATVIFQNVPLNISQQVIGTQVTSETASANPWQLRERWVDQSDTYTAAVSRNYPRNLPFGTSVSFSGGATVIAGTSVTPQVQIKNDSIVARTGTVQLVLSTTKSLGGAEYGATEAIKTATFNVAANGGTVTVNLPAFTPTAGNYYAALKVTTSGLTGGAAVTDTWGWGTAAALIVNSSTAVVTATLQNVSGSGYTPSSVAFSIGALSGSGNPSTISGVPTSSAQVVLGSQLASVASNQWGSREWWYAGSETFAVGSQSRVYTRNLPYQSGVTWRANNATISGSIAPNTPVTPRVTVANGASGTRSVTVEMKIDRVVGGTVSFNGSDYAQSAVVSVGASASATVDLPAITPTAAGVYQATYRITAANVDGSTARVTDTGGWADAFSVVETTTSVSATLVKGNGFANPANVQWSIGSQGPTNAGSGSATVIFQNVPVNSTQQVFGTHLTSDTAASNPWQLRERWVDQSETYTAAVSRNYPRNLPFGNSVSFSGGATMIAGASVTPQVQIRNDSAVARSGTVQLVLSTTKSLSGAEYGATGAIKTATFNVAANGGTATVNLPAFVPTAGDYYAALKVTTSGLTGGDAVTDTWGWGAAPALAVTALKFEFPVSALRFVRGTAFSIPVNIVDSSGVPVANLDAGVEDGALLMSRMLGKTDANGRVAVSYTAAQSAGLTVGTYQITVVAGGAKGTLFFSVVDAAMSYVDWQASGAAYGAFDPAKLSGNVVAAVCVNQSGFSVPMPNQTQMLEAGEAVGDFLLDWGKSSAEEFLDDPFNRVALVGALVACPATFTPAAPVAGPVCAGSLGFLKVSAIKSTVSGGAKALIDRAPQLSAQEKAEAKLIVDGLGAIYSVATLKPGQGLKSTWEALDAGWEVGNFSIEWVRWASGQLRGFRLVAVEKTTGETRVISVDAGATADPYQIGQYEPDGWSLFAGIPAENKRNLLDLEALASGQVRGTDGAALDADDGKLVIFFHGWNDSASRWTPLSDALTANARLPAGWKVIRYDWSEDAATGSIPITDSIKAAERAYQHGMLVGAKLLQQVGAQNLKEVHFIGHSAGCWAVAAAARYVNLNTSTTEVQVTFLDPYIPNNDTTLIPSAHPFHRSYLESAPVNCARVNTVGPRKAEADWSDDPVTLTPSYAGDSAPYGTGNYTQVAWTSWGTDSQSIVVRTDGTDYGSANWDGHDGPVRYYRDSIVNPLATNLGGGGWRNSLAYRDAETASTFVLSGRVTSREFPNSGVSGVTVSLNTGASTVTAYDGTYQFSGLVSGSYTVTASHPDYFATGSVATDSKNMTIAGTSVGSINFSQFLGRAAPTVSLQIDKQIPKPGDTINATIILQTGATGAANVDAYLDLSFDATHVTVGTPSSSGWNGGVTQYPNAQTQEIYDITGQLITPSETLVSAHRTGALAANTQYAFVLPLTIKSDTSADATLTLKYRATIGDRRDPVSTGSGVRDQQGFNVKTWAIQVAAETASVSVAANPPSGGMVTGAGTFAVGSTQILTATANAGYTFTGWTGGDTSTSNPLQITVPSGGATYTANFAEINTPPTISDILNQTINVGSNTGPLAFSVGDAQTAVGSLTVSGTSSDPALVPNSAIVFGGSGANRTVTVTPAAGQSGTATITVSVSDADGLSANDTFDLTVNGDSGTLPVVTTSPISEITLSNALVGGTVVSQGGSAVTARGYVFSRFPEPTVEHGIVLTDGSGLGTFSSQLTTLPLAPRTTYFMRAFATNSAGTAYGEERVFTTDPDLLAYYRFDGSAQDFSGREHSGASNSGVTFAAGQVGNAALFDGASGFITVADTAALNPGVAMTVSCWVKRAGTGAASKRIVDKIVAGDGSSGWGYDLGETNPGGAANWRFLFGSTQFATTPATSDWVHGAVTFDAGTVIYYENGVEIGRGTTSSASIPVNTLPLVIGASQSGSTVGGDYFHGAIDELRIYKRALTAAEIAGLATLSDVSTLAGQAGATGAANGVQTAARFFYPQGVVSAPDGDVFVADEHNNRIRRITRDGLVETLAGSGSGSADGMLSVATFARPNGIARDAAGNLFVVEFTNRKLRKITPDGTVSTLATFAGYLGAVAVDGQGGVYVSETASHVIRRIAPAGQVELFTGSPGSAGHVDGNAADARFNSPHGLAFDASANLYVADSSNHVVRRISSAGSVSTVAGQAGVAGSLDGVGGAALFRNPAGLAFDGAGNLFVTDSGNHVIRKIELATGVVSTVAGQSGLPGSADGPLSTAQFFGPTGITAASNGELIVADASNHTVRRVRLPVVTAAPAQISIAANPPAGGTVTGAGTFAVGSTQILTATPNAGYTFTGWADGNTSNPRQITVPSGGATYTADFSLADTQGPSVAVVSVTYASGAASATVSGTATDSGRGGNGVSSVTVNGVAATGLPVAGGATANWSASVPVVGGPQTVTIVATDSLNNATTLNHPVTVPESVALSPTTRSSPATGDSYTIQVSANTSWTASSNQTWAAITPSADTGNGTVTVTVAANTTAASRSATIMIGGQSHALTQSAPVASTRIIGLSLANSGAFGDVSLGGSVTSTLTITNTGNSVLSVSSISCTPSVFAGSWSGTLAPGASQAVTVTFSPTTVQPYTGAITVNSDATNVPVGPLAVSGTGTNPGTAPTATHAVVGSGYVAGSTVTISNTIAYTGTATGLGWQVLLPAGWSYASGGGSEGDVKPTAATTDLLEWAWTSIPASPVTFTYTLNVPASATGDKTLAALAIVRQGGSPSQVLATPDPLTVSQIVHHCADTNRDWKVSLLELTRVIELYNTRNGTTRTGCYKVEDGTEDGFAPEPTRTASTPATLTRYHCADTNHDGKLSLLELTRVIELYNYRSGTTRTGQYHPQAGTEDGFAPGPAP